MNLRTLTILSTLLLPLAAIAQTTTGNSQLMCTVLGATPTVRSEGYTEQVGDITISCIGGIAPAVGASIPAVNFTVFYNTAVTSRLLPVNGVSDLISEALLTIDEPGSGLPAAVAGFGPAAPQSPCATPLVGCTEYVSQKSGVNVATDSPQGTSASTPGKNVFQGVVGGNSVTFFGIPVLAPGSGTRVFRITNVRVNANPLLSFGSLTPVQASLSTSGATSLLVSNAIPLVAFVTSSLAGSVGVPPACGGCNIANLTPAATISFGEKFKTAFKTRVMAQNNTSNAGQNGTPGSNGFTAQNVPGAVYDSESGFVLPAGSGPIAGLADSGTRLKAVFNNVPTGLRLFVSVSNVDGSGTPIAPPAVIGGSAANTGTTGFAQLTASETGTLDPVAATGLGPGGVAPMVEIPVTNGSATAIWEVIDTNPNALENLNFVVYVYPGVAPSGGITVNLSYAPTPTNFAASVAASAALSVPRFVPDPDPARSLLAANLPSLRISKSHSGAFVQGQLGASYSVSVTNNALVSTNGSLVTVQDTMPAGMSATSISGSGWSCTLGTLTCTRSDVVAAGASFPAITVSVNVATNASSPLTNHATVAGGGSPVGSVDDLTTVLAPSATTGFVGPNWIDLVCPPQATAGSVVPCSVSLRLGAVPTVDSFAFSVAVTPNGSAPALTSGQLGFGQSVPGAVKSTDGTSNSMSVSWSQTSNPVSTQPLGALTFLLPVSAAGGQSYTVTITGASASNGGVPVNISPGLPNVVTIPLPGQPTCTANVTVTPNLRGEGLTEQTGDITLTCTGGTTPEVGTAIPQANLTVFYNVPVTSRLLTQGGNASEALLLIDEPGSGLIAPVPGFGPAAPLSLCPTPLTGCVEYVSQKSGSTIPVATDNPQGTAATTPGRNIFQGVVNGNSVTFYGIPVLPPGNNAWRVYRITNVRVNANVLGTDVSSGAGPVQTSISFNGAATVGISNNPQPYVGFVTPGITTSASAAPTASQCNSQNLTPASTVSFSENFGTAFKTRVAAQNNVPYGGQNGTPGANGFAAQNVPGGIYNSESDFVFPVAIGQTAGLSDYGTRLKAQFSVPAGVRLFVSTANVQNNGLPVTAPAVIGGSAANFTNNGIAYAQLTSSETGAFSAVASTTLAGSVPLVEIPVTNGVATAIWEMINTNPSTNEGVRFAVFTSYTANPGQNLPAPGVVTVNLSYAAAPPSFNAGTGAAASSTLQIPRFAADSNSARNAFTITGCSVLAPTATALTATPSGGANQYSLNATVTTTATGVGSPAGTVTFLDNGVALAGSTTTVSGAGAATFITVLSPGSHRLTAAFTPTNALAFLPSTSPEIGIFFGRSSTSVEITSNLYPSFAGQAVTFTATVTGAGTGAAPTGIVQFTDGSQSLGSAALAGGRASVTSTLTTVAVHNIFATYSGDGANMDSTARFGQRVERVTDSLKLTSSAASADFGQPVTLTATLAPQAPSGVAAATGAVQFQEGTTVIGTVSLTAGVATLAVSNLAAGAHQIFAAYSGDANWYGVRSDAVTVTVNRGVTTALLTSSATAAEVRLSAALTPAVSGGSVQFVDGTDRTVLGSVTVANGIAELAVSADDAAKIAGHSVTAVYSGTGGLTGSTSNALVLPALRNAAGGGIGDVASDELVSLFATKLGDAPEAALATALPPTLGGLKVNVADSSGAVFAGGLSYVSPSQVNFVMPSGLAAGAGLVTVTRGGVVVAAAPVKLGRVAPGLFEAFQTVKAENGDVYLVLYGTGIRNGSGVTCTVNGTSLPVAYAGAHRDFVGLDQVNVLLPAALRGTGTVRVSVVVDGRESNAVTIAMP